MINDGARRTTSGRPDVRPSNMSTMPLRPRDWRYTLVLLPAHAGPPFLVMSSVIVFDS